MGSRAVDDSSGDESNIACEALIKLSMPPSTIDEQPLDLRLQTEHTAALPPCGQATPGLDNGEEEPCVSDELSREKNQNVHEVAAPSASQLPSGAADDSSLMPSGSVVSEGPSSRGEAVDVKNLISILDGSVVKEFMKVDSESLIQDILHDTMKNFHRAYALYLIDGTKTLGDFRRESESHLEAVKCSLHEAEEELMALKESSRKDSEVIQQLNAECEEKNRMIKKLEEDVAKLVNENNKAYANWKQALLAATRSNKDLLNTLDRFLHT